MIETKERIQSRAMDLFMQYGIRSVSMDDIATQLGISKKTIYQYFADKNELVMAVVEEDIQDLQDKCMNCGANAVNAIDEIFLTMEVIQEILRNMNPMVLYDLQKFHFEAYKKWIEHKNNFLLNSIDRNIRWGIEDGLYRPDLNITVLAKFRLESIMIAFNIDVYPPAKYNLVEVTLELLEHFLFGLVTEKGYQLTVRNKQERSIHTKK